MRNYTFTTQQAAERIARILAMLQTPKTKAELAAEMRCGVETVRRYINMLALPDNKRVYVCDWRRNEPGPMIPVYKAGDKKDKPPRVLSEAERSKRRYKCPEYAMEQLMRNRKVRVKVRRDPLTAAFFGAA